MITALLCRQYLAERAAVDGTLQLMPVVFGADNPQCRIPEVQALVSKFTLYISLIAGILSAITSPKLGELSDRYGRRLVIAFITFGSFLDLCTYIATTKYPDTLSVYWLLVGAFADGICGSFTAALAVSNAYTADCTSPHKRAVAFGYFQGCLFTGIAAGPILAGYIIQATGQLLSIFYVALMANITFICFHLFIVPESVTRARQLAAREKQRTLVASKSMADAERGPWSWSRTLATVGRAGGLFTPLSILWPTGPGTTPALRRNLFLLAAVDTTMFGVAMGSITIVIIYSQYLLDWTIFETTRFVSIVNTSRVTVLLVLLPLVSRWVRGPGSRAPQHNAGSDTLDLACIRVAIIFDTIGYVGYATARSGVGLVLSGVIASVGGMGSPTLQSSLTKHVPAERTGQVLGAMGLLHALARVVAPTAFNLVYAGTVVRGWPQAVFWCLAGTFGVAGGMSVFLRGGGEDSLFFSCLFAFAFFFTFFTFLLLSLGVVIDLMEC